MKSFFCCLLLVTTACHSSSPNRVRVSSYPAVLEWFPVYLAQELGHFREAGIEVELQDISAGSKAMEALVAGSTDVVIDNYGYALIMAAQERKIQSIAVLTLLPVNVLAVTPTKASRIQRIADLKSATVGVGSFGGIHHRILEYLLSRHGLGIGDVTLVTIGTGPTAVAALEHGKVDAGVVAGGAFYLLKRRSPQTGVLVDMRTAKGARDAFGFDQFPTMSLLATADWTRRNPDAARKLCKAMVQTLHWIKEHSAEQVRARLPERMRTSDPEADLETLRYIMAGLSTDGRMPTGGPESVHKLFSSSFDKLREAAIDLSKTYTNEFLEAK